MSVQIKVSSLSSYLCGKSCSLDIMSICDFGYFLFWFLGQDFGSGCTRSCHCLLFTLLAIQVFIEDAYYQYLLAEKRLKKDYC